MWNQGLMEYSFRVYGHLFQSSQPEARYKEIESTRWRSILFKWVELFHQESGVTEKLLRFFFTFQVSEILVRNNCESVLWKAKLFLVNFFSSIGFYTIQYLKTIRKLLLILIHLMFICTIWILINLSMSLAHSDKNKAY